MRNRDARVAGFLYLLSIVIGWFGLIYLPDKLIVSGDAAATAHAIVANESLFRLAMLADIVGGTVWLFVVLALYKLLNGVDRPQANLMLVLGAFMQAPLYFVNVLNYVAALLLVTGANVFPAFSEAQRDQLAMLFLKLHHYEFVASFVFAGLWLVPFGTLVYRSRFLPRTLGVWLVVACFAYLAICFANFLTPQYAGPIYTIAQPLLLGEVAIALWLSVFGARTFGRL